MSRACTTLIAALAGASCVPITELELPAPAPGARSFLVAIVGPDRALLHAARTPADGRIVLVSALGPESAVVALSYAEDLEILQLEEGAVSTVAPGAPGRPVPRWSHASIARPTGRTWAWTEDTKAAELALSSVRIAPFSHDRCARSGGCVVHTHDTTCVAPCPEPDPPMAPRALMPPDVPQASCGDELGLRIGDTGPPLCERPSPVFAECPQGQVRFSISGSCTQVGTSCPQGQWPEGLTGPVLHVLAGAPPGGVGTEADPFATIQEAIDAAAPGTTVALSRHVHLAPVVLAPGVTLRGACVETVIDGTATSTAVTIIAPGAAVENLTVLGGEHSAILAYAPAELRLRDVVVGPGPGLGVAVARRASLDAERVLVRGRSRMAITVTGASSAVLRDALVQDTKGWGVAFVGSVAEVERLTVLDNDEGPLGHYSSGVVASSGATVTMRDVRIERGRRYGLVACDPRTRVTVEDALIRDLASGPGGFTGTGAEVCRGARLELSRTLIERTRTAGVLLQAVPPAPSVRIVGSVIRDIAPSELDDRRGAGVFVGGAGTLELEDVLVLRTHAWGVHAIADDASLTMKRVLIRDVLPQPGDTDGGWAIVLGGTATATLDRSWIDRPAARGILTLGEPELALTDVIISSTGHSPGPSSRSCCTAITATGGLLELERVSILSPKHSGVAVTGGGLRASDLSIHDVVADPAGGELPGVGLHVSGVEAELDGVEVFDTGGTAMLLHGSNARFNFTSVHIRGARGGGMSFRNYEETALDRVRIEGSSTFALRAQRDSLQVLYPDPIRVEDLVLVDTATAAGCTDDCGVAALRLEGTASFSALRFEIGASANVGISVEGASRVALSEGTVRDNPIGARITSSEAGPGDVLREVRYLRNGRAIAAP